MLNDFTEIAAYYDELYVKPEQYQAEAEKAITLIKKYCLSDSSNLLDLACGTGGHIPYWLSSYTVTGLDLSPEMLALARHKFPDIEFHLGDMVDFAIGKKFDVLVCLWGSIGFMRTPGNLKKALANFSAHLKPGGVLLLTPWSTREEFEPGIVVESVKHPDVRLACMENVKRKAPGLVEVDFHHLIGRDGKVTYHQQSIDIGLFSRQQYLDAIAGAGLELMEYYRGPEIRMGAFIARKSLPPN
jgi:SAM-dependent methyltransferase